MTTYIDINCDMGESYGRWTLGNDEGVMPHITSANIACGFHGGEPHVMRKTVDLALKHGVAIGAHPGLPDLMGFGRRRMELSPQEIKDIHRYQVGALGAFVHAAGAKLQHLLRRGAAQLQVLLEHVVLDAVRFDVLELRTRRMDERAEGADLVAVDVLDLLRRHFHPPPAEAHEVGQAGVGADGDAVLERQLHRLPHHVGLTPVEAAGDIRGGDVGHDGFVGAERPAAVALAHVAVDVDVRGHSFGKTSLATRSTCSGSYR